MKCKYEVIDNFLDEEYFDSLVTLFTDKEKTGNMEMPWFFQSSVSYPKKHKNWVVEDKLFYMIHMIYDKNAPASSFYSKMIPLFMKLESRCLMRVKANLYPNTHKLHEHPMHSDYEFSHSGAILSLNTCDGYTEFEDGSTVECRANRFITFPTSMRHRGVSQLDSRFKCVINFNYFTPSK